MQSECLCVYMYTRIRWKALDLCLQALFVLWLLGSRLHSEVCLSFFNTTFDFASLKVLVPLTTLMVSTWDLNTEQLKKGQFLNHNWFSALKNRASSAIFI